MNPTGREGERDIGNGRNHGTGIEKGRNKWKGRDIGNGRNHGKGRRFGRKREKRGKKKKKKTKKKPSRLPHRGRREVKHETEWQFEANTSPLRAARPVPSKTPRLPVSFGEKKGKKKLNFSGETSMGLVKIFPSQASATLSGKK